MGVTPTPHSPLPRAPHHPQAALRAWVAVMVIAGMVRQEAMSNL